MKNKVITIEDFMSMTLEEQDQYFDEKERLLNEGIKDDTKFDTMGMSGEEIMERYNFVPMDEFLNNLKAKLMSRNGTTGSNSTEGF